jgi:hypothetical protein
VTREAPPFLSRCRDCDGEIAWLRTRSGGRQPVQRVRQDGTPTHQGEEFSGRRHIHHNDVCPKAGRHQARRIGEIVEQAVAARPPESVAPPVRDLSDERLAAGVKWYRGLKKRGPRQAARLAELETEIDRRRTDALPPRSVPDYKEQ